MTLGAPSSREIGLATCRFDHGTLEFLEAAGPGALNQGAVRLVRDRRGIIARITPLQDRRAGAAGDVVLDRRVALASAKTRPPTRRSAQQLHEDRAAVQIGLHGRSERVLIGFRIPALRQDAQPGLGQVSDKLLLPRFQIVRRARQEYVFGGRNGGRARFWLAGRFDLLQGSGKPVAEIDDAGQVGTLFHVGQTQGTSGAAGLGVLSPEFESDQVAEFGWNGRPMRLAAMDDENPPGGNAITNKTEEGIALDLIRASA